MHPIFSVTLYTGQQLMLAGLQRWLYRPCAELDQYRRQRAGLRSLLVLLLKTAATGVVATVLDAAIEYRRRQLLAAPAGEEADDASAAQAGRFGLGSISRAGIASWKARLLHAIDEAERQAVQYGLSGRRREAELEAVSEAEEGKRPLEEREEGEKEAGAEAAASGGEERGSGAGKRLLEAGEDDDEEGAGAQAEAFPSRRAASERRRLLGRTVEQLQALMRARSERDGLEEGVDALVDALLGDGPLGARSAPATPLAPSLDVLAAPPRRSRSFAVREEPEARSEAEVEAEAEACPICMDRALQVAIAGCEHALCFACARRLCSAHDHALPACPLCRAPIEGFLSRV